MEQLAPGKSLESDLRLIREAKGLSREEIFNRVHIRPEVLAQVEEHGFGATPTLSSDIHRRSFVKHYADAIEIDAEIALAALQKSLTGFYDGSLAVEYLGLEELKAVPRWAQPPAEDVAADTADEPSEDLGVAASQPADVDFNVVPAEPNEPEFDIPLATESPVFPAPEPDHTDDVIIATEQATEPEEVAAPESAAQTEEVAAAEPEVQTDKVAAPEPEVQTDEAAAPQPEAQTEEIPETESEVAPDLEIPTTTAAEMIPEAEAPRVSPYAPPKMTSTSTPEDQAPPQQEPTVFESKPEIPAPTAPSAEHDQPVPKPVTARRKADPMQDYNIPSSTMKESVIGPPDDDDYGDEDSFWVKLRSRHWLTWIGLTGVVVVLALVIGQRYFGQEQKAPVRPTGFATVEDLPDQFSGIIRLTPTTERFVNLQILPDSLSSTDFTYRMWTDSEGSIYAEGGEGRLNVDDNQILLGEPYGVGGVFILEGGAVRIRSVRRIRFPRWEFTGRLE